MPFSDPHTWEIAKVFMIGAPFTVRPDNQEREWDMQRIVEKVIAGFITAMIVGFGAWFMFIQDMKLEQKLIRQELTSSIVANDIAHQTIIDDHNKTMIGISEDLTEIKAEIRAFRNDLYIPHNGVR